jgi:hypothetical protein
VYFPFDLRSATMFDSQIPCRSTAMPRICRSKRELSRPRQVRGRVAAGSGHGMCKLASAVQRRYVGDLPGFGFFRLPHGYPGRLLSELCQSQMQVASVKQCNDFHRRGEAYYFGGRACVLVYFISHRL